MLPMSLVIDQVINNVRGEHQMGSETIKSALDNILFTKAQYLSYSEREALRQVKRFLKSE